MKKFYQIHHLYVALLSMLCALTLSVSVAYADAPTQTEQTETTVSADHQAEAAEAPDGTDIIGGTEARVGEFPWQVFLEVDRQSNGSYNTCGGSLIHPEWILTAAHCIGNRSHVIYIGAHDVRNEADHQRISASRAILHPNYNPNSLDNDIALIKLSRPAALNSRVAVVPLIAASGQGNLVSVGATSTIAGWGTTRPNRTRPSDVLLKVNVPLVSNQTCQSGYSLRVTNNMLCAGFASGGRDTCGGDSGGALTVRDRSGRTIQAGIVSWGGELCAQPNSYGVYTRVSNYINWISRYVPLSSTPSTPTPTPSGDRYENDDTSGRAKSISTNGTRQTHNIHRNSDIDWLKFSAVRGQEYVVETLNLGSRMDSQIWVYNPNNNYLYNDDISNSNRRSHISFTAAQNGTYYIAVRHYDNSISGGNTNYDIRVRTVTSTPSGDAYETDNQINQARSISTNNGRQNHNFHSRNDRDWVKFSVRNGSTYIVDTLNLESRADTAIYLYDSSGNLLLRNNNYRGKRSRLRFRVGRNMTLYLMVRQANGNVYGQNTGYTLRARTVNGYAAGIDSSTDSTASDATALVELVDTPVADASAVGLYAAYPNSIHNRQDKSLVLEGAGLTESEVDVYLDDTLLTTALVEEDQIISVLVPAGIDPGTYDITLVDGAGGRTTLADGLVITGEPFDHKIYLPLIR